MRFEHAGHSTQGLVDPRVVMAQAGVKPGDVFLDAGSGSGYLAMAASRLVGPTGKVYALDADAPSVDGLNREVGRLGITNVVPLLADLTRRIPLGDGTIDICHMGSVLHGFVENHEETPVMRELARVVKKGGKLVVVEFKKVAGPPGPPLPVSLAQEQVISLCAGYGFRETAKFEAGQYHYGVTFTGTG